MDDEDAIAKPDELLALSAVAAELFETLRRWFDVPPRVSLDLSEVDSAVTELGDPVLVAAMAMRKLQALHLLATPGVRTTTDVVVAIVQDLQRALIQAPTMRLKLAAAATDWDAELASLDHPAGSARAAPATADEADPDADRFRALHVMVNMAMEATVAASDGQIRTLL
ncbi:MAG TPA: hypothetical protein VE395_03820 [Acidimicrobiales bacterium]|nr:hypothetical protein [Acidimicrobiales bacterium]